MYTKTTIWADRRVPPVNTIRGIAANTSASNPISRRRSPWPTIWTQEVWPMMRFAAVCVALLLWASASPVADGQAAVEYGLGLGSAATTAPPVRDLGKKLGDVMEQLNKAVSGQANAAASKQA